jgi:DNA-binding response OmpR family regulator
MFGRRKPTILIVEDYADTREMIRILLEESNYRVLATANGKDALEVTARETPDLILTDFNLPDIDGITLIRKIRKLGPEMRNIPVIMITAREREEVCEMAATVGCNAVITKPVSFSVIENTIRALLKRSMYGWTRNSEAESRTLP